MKWSAQKIASEAAATGFRPEILEKAMRLLHLLQVIQSHPFLQDKLALKGGTALNLFFFDLPRLSVDIDLDYVVQVDRDAMMQDRPQIEEALQAVFSREGLRVTRAPKDHAGGKWRVQYDSAMGRAGNLDVDINFMFRVALWPVNLCDSKPVGSQSAQKIPVRDIHEIAAGKLAALLSRKASRDLFDTHQLLTKANLDARKLRLAFVLYGAMNRKDWRTVAIDDVAFERGELENQLIPMLRREALEAMGADWAQKLVAECRDKLGIVLPLTKPERDFLDHLLGEGRIMPELLTTDLELQRRITIHPLLQWKAQNVQEHRNPIPGLSDGFPPARE